MSEFKIYGTIVYGDETGGVRWDKIRNYRKNYDIVFNNCKMNFSEIADIMNISKEYLENIGWSRNSWSKLGN